MDLPAWWRGMELGRHGQIKVGYRAQNPAHSTVKTSVEGLGEPTKDQASTITWVLNAILSEVLRSSPQSLKETLLSSYQQRQS